jgi:hypothetical protein
MFTLYPHQHDLVSRLGIWRWRKAPLSSVKHCHSHSCSPRSATRSLTRTPVLGALPDKESLLVSVGAPPTQAGQATTSTVSVDKSVPVSGSATTKRTDTAPKRKAAATKPSSGVLGVLGGLGILPSAAKKAKTSTPSKPEKAPAPKTGLHTLNGNTNLKAR